METVRVGVVGATGYSGAVAARLLATHPSFSLEFCTSDQRAGQPVGPVLGVPTPEGLVYAPNGQAVALASSVDAVLLATSAEVSTRLAPAILDAKRVVVDFSGAFRLATASEYPKWYGFEHPRGDLLARAFYGVPELFGAPARQQGEGLLVSNPGCYPTAALLALAPLLRAGLVAPRGIVIDAKSGTTGAGRQAKEEYAFSEVDEDVRAYKLFGHQHTPEIARHLARAAGLGEGDVRVTFTPHLMPLRRGLLATCYARPQGALDPKAVTECLFEAYRAAPFVDVVPPAQVTMASVAGTNRARVGATCDGEVVIAIGVIDNLLKGAAGQAIQTLNRVFGLDETTGLAELHRFAP